MVINRGRQEKKESFGSPVKITDIRKEKGDISVS